MVYTNLDFSLLCLACPYPVKSRALLARMNRQTPQPTISAEEFTEVDLENPPPKRSYMNSTEDIVHLCPP